MIKASTTHADGRPLVFLGLSDGNLVRLREGKPILIDMKPYGLDGWAVIMHGATEEDITRELAKYLNLPS